jgi:predicted transcriptional regulator
MTDHKINYLEEIEDAIRDHGESNHALGWEQTKSLALIAQKSEEKLRQLIRQAIANAKREGAEQMRAAAADAGFDAAYSEENGCSLTSTPP